MELGPMRLNPLWLLLLAAPLAGQGRPETVVRETDIFRIKVEIRNYTDRFSDVRHVGVKKAKRLAGPASFYDVTLHPLYSQSPGMSGVYGFEVIYQGKGWMFMTGEVILLVD